MPYLIAEPTVIEAAGNKPKRIEEYAGGVNSEHEGVSVARMVSPEGWQEPGQRPEFEEITLVLKGTLRVEHVGGVLVVAAGQAVVTQPGEWVRYSSPEPGGAEYVAVCLPAFSPDTVHRDENDGGVEMTAPKMDLAKADAFADKLVGIINDGSLALMTSVGHRTGLFDTMASLAPSTSKEIAEAANLNERYVREWLGAMVTGRIVDHDAENGTYILPPEHAASLTRAAKADNIAVFTQYISVLGGVEDAIVDSFRNGGGVPYSEYPRFHEVMAEDSGLSSGAALVESILPLVPGLVERLEAGIDVLDVGCGSGHAINLIAQAFPKSRCVGYDFSEEAIVAARAEAERMGVMNARFAVRDVTVLNEAAGYDLITAFDAIHDQAKPRSVLKCIAEALRPDGTFLMQDIAGSSHVHKNLEHPIAPFLYTISCMHCMTVSLALDGEGLGAMWGEEKAHELLTEAGFTGVEVKRLSFDIQNAYYVITKG